MEDPQVIQMSLGATVGCCSLLVGVWGKEGKGREEKNHGLCLVSGFVLSLLKTSL